MTKIEKLQAVCDLMTTLTQHTKLSILPSGFAAHEDTHDGNEFYEIEWQNGNYYAAISLDKPKDVDRYVWWVHIIDTRTSEYKYIKDALCNIESLDEDSLLLKEFIDFVNRSFSND